MASVEVTRTFTFEPDEISLLLKLVGREAPAAIEKMGFDKAVQESLYEALSEAAYAPMREDRP